MEYVLYPVKLFASTLSKTAPHLEARGVAMLVLEYDATATPVIGGLFLFSHDFAFCGESIGADDMHVCTGTYIC